jgi:hypothetical protein
MTTEEREKLKEEVKRTIMDEIIVTYQAGTVYIEMTSIDEAVEKVVQVIERREAGVGEWKIRPSSRTKIP